MHKRASSRNISVAQAMKLMLKKMLATNILVFGFAVPVTAGSLEDGRAAYEHRDFAIAERLFRPLAEHGNAIAQYNLGVLCYNGQGTLQSYTEALTWFRQAADQGSVQAQINLGAMYANGQGAPQDYIQAHMWLSLAAAKSETRAVELRNTVAVKMTAAQIAEAQKLAREWKPTKQPPPR